MKEKLLKVWDITKGAVIIFFAPVAIGIIIKAAIKLFMWGYNVI